MVKDTKGEFHVLIIGAGTTGLSIAQGLKQLGVKYTVFERQDENDYVNRQREWSMGFHWGADHVSHWPQDIKDGIAMAQAVPNAKMTDEEEHTVPLVNGKTGEPILKFPTASTRRVNRRKLRHLLVRGIDVQFGKKLVRIDDHGSTLTAIFEDGSTAEGNIILGCDSAQSKVRQFVLPPEKINLEYLPFVPLHFTCKYTADQANFIRSFHHRFTQISPHPDQQTMVLITIADIGDEAKPETCTFQLFYTKWGGVMPTSNTERVALLKEIAENYCEPFRSAALWVKEDTPIYSDRLVHWPNPQQWNNHGGRVTLAGDAAHPMSPHRGQGLNNALEDAGNYVEAITSVLDGKQSLNDAINAYDEEVLARGKKEIDVSFQQAVAFHRWDMIMESPLAKKGQYKLNDEEWRTGASRMVGIVSP